MDKKKKALKFFKYFKVDYYSVPENVPVVSLRGMIYMQIAVFLFIILVGLSLGTTDTI